MSDTFDPNEYRNKRAAYEAGLKEGKLAALDGETDGVGDDKLTFAQVQQMSSDEINARWAEVKEVLERSGAA